MTGMAATHGEINAVIATRTHNRRLRNNGCLNKKQQSLNEEEYTRMSFT
jgi:hypothetical protein